MFRRKNNPARKEKASKSSSLFFHGSHNKLSPDSELVPAAAVPPSMLPADHPLVVDRLAALASTDAWRFERVWLSRSADAASEFAPGGFVYVVSAAGVAEHNGEFAAVHARVLRQV